MERNVAQVIRYSLAPTRIYDQAHESRQRHPFYLSSTLSRIAARVPQLAAKASRPLAVDAAGGLGTSKFGNGVGNGVGMKDLRRH